MFSKDMLLPLSSHMPFCLALHQNKAKVIPHPKELVGSAARDTAKLGAPWKQQGNTSCTRASKLCLAYRKETLRHWRRITRQLIRCCGGIFCCKRPQNEYEGLEWRMEKVNKKGLGPGLVRGESMLLISKRNRARATGITVKRPGSTKGKLMSDVHGARRHRG